MDQARCTCTRVQSGLITDPGCPVHGLEGSEPLVAFKLSVNDRKFLRSIKVDPDR